MPLRTALPNVGQEIKAAIAKDIKRYPVRSNYASAIGFPCIRNLVYRRLDSEKLPLKSVELEMIFRGGKVIERNIAKPYLEAAGFDIVEMGRRADWPEKQIGGELDFVIRRKDLPLDIPVETKGLAHHVWEKINTIEDFLQSRQVYHQTYPGQLTIYMLNRNMPLGLFLIISKATFEPKGIWVDLDYTYAEELIKKAEIINSHVAAKTYPDRIPFDHSICGKCDFKIICLPDIMNKPSAMIDDQILEDDISDFLEARKAGNRANWLRKSISVRLEAIEKAVVGTRFVCEWVPSNRASYEEIPLDVANQIKALQAPYAKKGRILEIQDLDKKVESE